MKDIEREGTSIVSWALTSGSCTIDGSCVMSPGWPGSYGNDERCEITVTSGGVVTAESFATESGYDYITLAGVRYEGSSGPQDVTVTAGSVLTWYSDGSDTRAGWRICLAVADGALRFAKGASSNALCKQLARAAAVGEARFGDRVRGVDLGRGDARLRALGYDQQPPQSGFYDAVVLAGSVAEVSTKDGANF